MKSIFGLLLLLFVSANITAQDNKVKFMYSGAEMLKIMEQSVLKYTVKGLENGEEIKIPEYPPLSSELYLGGENKKTIMTFEMTEEMQKADDAAKDYFKKQDWENAEKYYRKMYELDNKYVKALTLIADTYYARGDYETAKKGFIEAIGKNFVDYQAHWFLADTYYKLRDLENALKEITLAHLLNRNHVNIFKRLINLREQAGKEWKEWDLIPRCNTYEEGDLGVVVKAEKGWLGYAMAEAAWKYEPGFSKGILGYDYTGNVPVYEKEAACVFANFNAFPEEIQDKLNNAAEEGFFQIMILYEIVTRYAPATFLTLSDEVFNKFIEYVNKYH